MWFRMKKKREVRHNSSFMKNGSMLLEELITSRNGNCNPICNFTAKELERATNKYEYFSFCFASECKLYKGSLQDKSVFVKKFEGEFVVHPFVVRCIVITSQMSVHKNVLKLIGCCLETEIPILVHEFAGNGSLEDKLFGSHRPCWEPLPWKCRLRIARDIASVVAYLHTAFSRPIIHRDVRPSVILLDQENVAKLSDFSLCISIPVGQLYAEDAVRGRMTYIAPEYAITGYLTEKVDVFAFGVLLYMLLSGKQLIKGPWGDDYFALSNYVEHYADNNLFREVVDPMVQDEEQWPEKEQQLQDFAALALRCINVKGEERPTMIEVAKQLKQIELSAPC